MIREEAFVFDCEGDTLVGILHHPREAPLLGILMIVGGPQYRVGSHRQFVEFARAQCELGRAVMRFDYRGMGDSSGPYINFEKVQSDVATALQEFLQRVPSLDSVVLFGLCDGAAASLMHAPTDEVVGGMMLLNPWARNAKTQAKTVVKHYYRQRFLSTDFWKKLFTGKADVFGSLRSLLANVQRSVSSEDEFEPKDFRTRMLEGARRFSKPVLVVLSADDMTANEFREMIKQSADWQAVTTTPKWTWKSLPTANHTFSNYAEKQQVIDLCSNWMERLRSDS